MRVEYSKQGSRRCPTNSYLLLYSLRQPRCRRKNCGAYTTGKLETVSGYCIFGAPPAGRTTETFTFRTEAEAVKMANDTEYGLAAYFYNCDIGCIWRVAEALEYRTFEIERARLLGVGGRSG